DDIGVISTIREDIEIDLSEAWIDEVRSLNGRPHWLPPTESGYLQRAPMPLFAYGMLLGEYNIGSHDFILLVQMKAEVLDDLVASIRTSDGGAAAILDKQGRLIAHHEDIVIGDRLSIPDEPVAGTTRLDD